MNGPSILLRNRGRGSTRHLLSTHQASGQSPGPGRRGVDRAAPQGCVLASTYECDEMTSNARSILGAHAAPPARALATALRATGTGPCQPTHEPSWLPGAQAAEPGSELIRLRYLSASILYSRPSVKTHVLERPLGKERSAQILRAPPTDPIHCRQGEPRGPCEDPSFLTYYTVQGRKRIRVWG
jgi:hypothetical protein